MTNQRENKTKSFLELPYDLLEEMNLNAVKESKTKTLAVLEKKCKQYLAKEKNIKAITLCFSDIEGRLHMLDYDKKYFIESYSNLTFDGSSVRGFSEQCESDLRFSIDWSTMRWLPSDVFGPGKVIMFANVLNRDRTPYTTDFRGQLQRYITELKKDKGIIPLASAEIEGFLVDGPNTEQHYKMEKGFKLISSGGYFHSLPLDPLRLFIDKTAEAQRAMGFKNEKDHPEVAPSQFELNFAYDNALRICDQIQLYKLICRQIADSLEMTVTFLPKPIANISGSGMHLNLSFNQKGKNIFYQKNGEENLSKTAWSAVYKILNHAPELSLMLNSSVNAYRRLDPSFEAPNQIKVSAVDRGAMVRIPIGNEKTTRLEIRSVGPDANPYLAIYGLLKTISYGKELKKSKQKRDRLRYLPGNINDAIRIFKASRFIDEIIGKTAKEKFAYYKQRAADRSPKELGTTVKTSEIIYHHEITNQMLWNNF